MGVIPCDRAGCDNIMCDARVMGDRICDSCLEELRDYVPTVAGSERHVEAAIHSFMKSPRYGNLNTKDITAIQEKLESLISVR